MPAAAQSSARLGAGRPAIPDILDEHLEERAFLWIARRSLIFSADVPLRRLPEHDERIEAHTDGLAIGERASAAIAEKRLEDDNPWVAASATCAWLDLGGADAATAFARLESLPPKFVPAWREALRWASEETIERLFPLDRVGRLPALPLSLAVDALAWRSKLDPAIASLAAAHADAAVRASVARGLAWPGSGPNAAALLPKLRDDADAATRRRARWCEALRDPEAARDRMRGTKPEKADAFDARLLGLFGEAEDANVLQRWAEADELRAASLTALGDLGSESAIETLLRVLDLPNDEVKLEATVALERALGPLEGEPGDDPKPAPPATARAQWRALRESSDARRFCRGRALPWDGEAREEPMLWVWRRSLTYPTRSTRWMTMHAPDGFWSARASVFAVPGE